MHRMKDPFCVVCRLVFARSDLRTMIGWEKSSSRYHLGVGFPVSLQERCSVMPNGRKKSKGSLVTWNLA
jgi:hypothetical protein